MNTQQFIAALLAILRANQKGRAPWWKTMDAEIRHNNQGPGAAWKKKAKDLLDFLWQTEYYFRGCQAALRTNNAHLSGFTASYQIRAFPRMLFALLSKFQQTEIEHLKTLAYWQEILQLPALELPPYELTILRLQEDSKKGAARLQWETAQAANTLLFWHFGTERTLAGRDTLEIRFDPPKARNLEEMLAEQKRSFEYASRIIKEWEKSQTAKPHQATRQQTTEWLLARMEEALEKMPLDAKKTLRENPAIWQDATLRALKHL